MDANVIYSTEHIELLELAATRCEELAQRLETCEEQEYPALKEALAVAVGDTGPVRDGSFTAVVLSFIDNDVSGYERGVSMVYYACDEGPSWVSEAQRDCYLEMLATVFGMTRDEVMHDVERVRASHAIVARIEENWL